MSRCEFLVREFKGLDLYMGLFRYTHLTCAGGSCTSLVGVIPSKYCIPYPHDNYNWRMQASRASSFLVILFGGMSLLFLCVSTCLSMRKLAWQMITCTLLLTSIFQGLVLLMNHSALCNTIDHHEIDVTFESECSLSVGATQAIIACCLYFLTAIGSNRFARMKGY